MRGLNVAWLSTWDRVCGIAEYSKALFPWVKKEIEATAGGGAAMISLDDCEGDQAIIDALKEFGSDGGGAPDILHVQHEYGLFGGKNPPGYSFPSLVRMIREEFPSTKIVATAHTVLGPDYRFPVKGRGYQVPLRMLANAFLLPSLRKIWGRDTWGGLDGVVVHSRGQIQWVEASGCPRVIEIPHFVYDVGTESKDVRSSSGSPVIVVFGFLTPEKGQDLAIEALAEIRRLYPAQSADVTLILAGGLRREDDRTFWDYCEARIKELGLCKSVMMTGFVPAGELDTLYRSATLVVTPFRATSGSGSIAQALARGAAILASDLKLNREIDEREPGCLEFFESGNVRDLAEKANLLISSSQKRDLLAKSALRYAEKFGPSHIAKLHLELYRGLIPG